MNMSRYLIVNEHGRARITKSRPSLAMDEIAIRLELVLPNSLFKKPLIEGIIVVDEKAVTPLNLTPEILINTAQMIEQSTGMKIQLSVVEPQRTVTELKLEPS